MKTKQLRYSTLVGVMITGLAVVGAGWAATDTTTFSVTATVTDACEVSATDLAFGTYDPNAGDLDATSTITANCTAGTEYDIGLDDGANSGSADSTNRAMTDGSGFLDYELYLDAARSSVWGTTIGVDTRNNPSATAGGNTETVYGQIPADQFVGAGSYSDTINVTLTF